ncbi:MAG TPA: hypothetical protein VN841_14405 [Bryobacteraceae bacterium]|nr:hypothetical protein [Bryobacteraceae bacterium]
MKLSTPVVLLAWSSLLAFPALAQTQIGGGTCNSSTLNGTYELSLSGRQVTSAGAVSKVLNAVGTAAFDGQSKVTLTMTANIVSAAQNFGNPLVYSGTYSLQSNCLGSVSITTGDTATFNLESFNIPAGTTTANTFQLYGSDATYAYSGGGNIQPSTCPTTLMGIHEFNGTGSTLSGTSFTGTLDVAGVLTFDGQGTVTANWTQASNTNTTTISATGTYLVTPGCLASATLTDTASNKYTMSLSIYSTAPDFVVEVSSPQEIFQGSGSAALPAAAAGTCSASNLNGTYELQLAGRQVTAAGITVKILQATGAATFDGASKVSFAMTGNSINGTQAFGAALAYSGTYTLPSNCQGSISITTGDTATFSLVAYSVNATTQVAAAFTIVGTDATFAYNTSGNLQPAACSVSTLSGSWPFSATGSSLSGAAVNGVADVLGLLTFDGQGNATGNWTTSSNTATTTVTASGTYSVTSACLGSVTLADSANNKYSWSVSVFGAAANNFLFAVSNAAAIFTGTGRAAFVNPGLAVVNAASFTAGATPAGSVFTVFGFGLATGQSQPSTIPLPTTVLTTTVTVNGEPAPIFYVNQTQINAQMPEDIQPGLATVIVKNGSATSNSVAVTVPATGTPGIVVYGQNRAVVVNQNNSVNSTTAPAKVGDVVVAYFTGGGPVTAAGKLVTGAPTPSGLSPVSGSNTVTVGGVTATTAYIGLTPGGIGLYQANFTIPKVAAGDRPLVITIAGQASNRPLIAISN